MDMEVDGKMRGPVHPVWATYRHLIKNAKVFLNGAISLVEAEELLKDHTADVIVFGRPWLVNPDFASAAIEGKEKELQFEYNFDVSFSLPLPWTLKLLTRREVLRSIPSWQPSQGLH
jgi:2,4-dienoyl-CoA reductase-like NADH-dependent reductase (Old Yellow Enzyme family)